MGCTKNVKGITILTNPCGPGTEIFKQNFEILATRPGPPGATGPTGETGLITGDSDVNWLGAVSARNGQEAAMEVAGRT